MPRMVEIEYNPYIPQLQIVIDGLQPPDFSRLIQYSDEDIWQWAHEIVDTIYAEVRDDFILSFTGTEQDAAIIRFVCEKCKNCVGFKHKDFQISDSLPKRMGKLNQLIKKAGITTYKKTVIDATFLIHPTKQQYLEDIMSIDINNLFCAVRVSTIGLKSQIDESHDFVLFILSESLEDGLQYLQKTMLQKPAFILVLGNSNRVLSVTRHGWVIETTQDQLFTTIFNCFIQMPLISAFRKCASSIREGNKIAKELQLILCTEPIISISTNKEVEIGKSIRVITTQEPDMGPLPKLIYKMRNQQIASCDGLSVYGLVEGDCVLEVYRSGSKQPFFTKDIHVYKRNRISKLILSDDTLLLGVSDHKRIALDFYPEDADNTNEISWRSTDKNIVSIDSAGNVSAIAPGSCRIICTAENVSAQCLCTVKPYLEDLVFDFSTDENGKIVMCPLQELVIGVQRIPGDCIDGEITISSSNNDIVNVVNSTLYAKNGGEAIITIKNSSARIDRSFCVVVSKQQQQKKKSGFLSKFFK